MKILFLSNRFETTGGGGELSRAHYNALSKIANEIHVVSLRSAKDKADDANKSNEGITRLYSRKSKRNKEILKSIDEYKPDLIWLGDVDAKVGSVIKDVKCKFHDIQIFVFHHVMDSLKWSLSAISFYSFDVFRTIRRTLRALLAYSKWLREIRIFSKIADANILLNDRDKILYRQYCNKEPDLILPVCYVDKSEIKTLNTDDNKFNLLFVGAGGSNTGPNVKGIKWFAREVLPKLNKKAVLNIVGKNMDKMKNEPEFKNNPRVKITGFVESLDDFYNMADLIVVPVFVGGGMMTKVCEALMYGKNILSTGHALNGYEGLDDCRCDTAEEFITKINAMIENPERKKFNPAMRKLYEDKYSIKAMENMLRKFMREKGFDV